MKRVCLSQDMPELVLDGGTPSTPGADVVPWDPTLQTNPDAAAAINRGCPAGYFALETPHGMVCRLLSTSTPATMQSESAGPQTWSQTIANATSALGDIGGSAALALASALKPVIWIAGGIGALMLLNSMRKQL